MRPGEILPGDGPAPAARPARTATIRVENRGRLPAYLGALFPLELASRALAFPREEAAGARVHLPAGATVRIDPGEAVDVEVAWS